MCILTLHRCNVEREVRLCSREICVCKQRIGVYWRSLRSLKGVAEELNLLLLVVYSLPVLEVEGYGQVLYLGVKLTVECCLALNDVVAAVRVLDDILKYLVVIVVDAESVKLHLGNHTEEVAVC